VGAVCGTPLSLHSPLQRKVVIENYKMPTRCPFASADFFSIVDLRAIVFQLARHEIAFIVMLPPTRRYQGNRLGKPNRFVVILSQEHSVN